MNIRLAQKFLLIFALIALLGACADDDSFSTSPTRLLTFSTDTVKLDTLFSNVTSATKTVWVYNRSGDGVRISSVRLERGGNSGFIVNVDGANLGESSGYQATGLELRNKDSLRVFVGVNLKTTGQSEPQECSDNLVFTLESGVEQRVNLDAWAWDATMLRAPRYSSDATLSSPDKPVVIYGGLRVDSGATLTIGEGTTLYFHTDAGMDVYGKVVARGTAERPITFRGDRIDRMFAYLPYDRVPGQWMGITLHPSSYENEFDFVDIHSALTGIAIDSSDVSRQKLTLSHATIHNCQGYGILADNAKLTLNNVQLTNCLHDCLRLIGGDAELNGCTLAQFYAFDSSRGMALSFTDSKPIVRISIENSLITGYADDVFLASIDTEKTQNYVFNSCIIRTPRITTADSVHFHNVIYEDVADTLTMGIKHFRTIDEDNLIYDFRLDSVSAAIGKANPQTALPDDRLGVRRDDHPDIGAYEYHDN